mmetsp:Transcript_1430/g.3713  ORF Transcript_1430/g.3713 Transcript_1430/m.3713 type:complete len:238 (-) Transcript_1430:248-961(-)
MAKVSSFPSFFVPRPGRVTCTPLALPRSRSTKHSPAAAPSRKLRAQCRPLTRLSATRMSARWDRPMTYVLASASGPGLPAAASAFAAAADADADAATAPAAVAAAGRRRRSWCSPLPQSGMSLPQGRAAALRAASAAAAAGSSSGAVSTCVSGSGSIWVALTLSFVAAPWWKSPAALARLPRLPRGAARSGDGHGPATPDLTLATLATLILPRGSSRCPDQNPSLNTGPPWARVWTA